MNRLDVVGSFVMGNVLSLSYEPFLTVTANFLNTDIPKSQGKQGWVLQLSHTPELFDGEGDFEVIATSNQ